MNTKYLNEKLSYGGIPMTRGAIMKDMQELGYKQILIDRWMQGAELAKRIHEKGITCVKT